MNDFVALSKQESLALSNGAFGSLNQILRKKELLLSQGHHVDPSTRTLLKEQATRLTQIIPMIQKTLRRQQELEKLRHYVVAYNRPGQKIEIAIQ